MCKITSFRLYLSLLVVLWFSNFACAAVWEKDNHGLYSGREQLLFDGSQFLAFCPWSHLTLSSTDGLLWRRLNQTAPDLNAVAFNGTHYLGVGASGQIWRSSDGLSWQNMTSPVATALHGIVAAGGKWIVVGSGGKILDSSNGEQWAIRVSGTTNTLHGVAFGNGRFVAVGANGAIVRSMDGVTWTAQSLLWGDPLTAVAYGSSGFVAVGGYGSPSSGFAYLSADGQTWEQVATIGSPFRKVVFGNGTYAATTALGVMTASNGRTWTSRFGSTYADTTSIAAGAGRLVATAVGTDGPMAVVSENGTDWGLEHSPRAYVTGPDRTIVVGAAGSLLVTQDGRSWRAGVVGANYYNAIAYGTGKYLVVNNYAFNGWTVRTSLDGFSWTPGSNVSATTLLSGLCYGNGLFVVVGYYNSYLATSPDGITWTQRSAPNIYYQSVAYGASGFVAVGEGGQIAYSTDGLLWIKATNANTNYLWEARHLNNRYWAVGDSGTVAWSDTGTSWSSAQIPNAGRLKSIAYAFGKYVVGNVYGKLFSSRNGVDWNEEASGTMDPIAKIFPVGDSLIVMSSKAGILRQNAFGNWLSERFAPISEQQDEQVTGPLSDPDGDGVGNLMEYALDTNPKQAEGSPQPLRMEGELLYYRYLRSRRDIDYKVECSYSLDAEAWSSVPVNQGSGEVGTFVDASMPLDNRSVFLRLNAALK